MPETIEREEAMARVASSRVGENGSCVICAIAKPIHQPLIVAEGRDCVVLLPRYALRWGHLMVVTREHVTSFSALPQSTWQEASVLAWQAARVLEATLSPLRCYVASLGTARDDLPMTSPHLHTHVVPLHDPDDRPASVLTWSNGVMVAKPAEWANLQQRLSHAWDAGRRD